MGKKRTQERKSQNQRDLTTVRAIAAISGVQVTVLNDYPMHLRLRGERVYDYWPSTHRAWEYGTEMKSAVKVDPCEVVGLTLDASLPESASEHLNALKVDQTSRSDGEKR